MISTARRSLLPGAITFYMIALGWPNAALAQVNVKYTFSLPVAKAVPNPCTGGFELLNATTSITINTVESLTAFNLSIAATSSGTGSDAKADGTLIPTGLPDYRYGSDTNVDAGFAAKPASFAATFPISDYLVRTGIDTGDSFLLNTVLRIGFTNGLPTTPTLQQLDVQCQ
jgi:hypothetical protein